MPSEVNTRIGEEMIAAHAAYYTKLSEKRDYVSAEQAGQGPWNNVVVRGRRVPGKRPHTVDLQTTWRKIAQMCIDAGVLASDYVTDAFSIMLDNGGTVKRPEDLANPLFFQEYMKERQTSEGSLNAHWAAQEQQLRQAVRWLKVEPEWLLNNAYQTWEPWFRLMYLTPYNRLIHDTWWRIAITDIRRNRALRNYLRKKAPENFAKLQALTDETFAAD